MTFTAIAFSVGMVTNLIKFGTPYDENPYPYPAVRLTQEPSKPPVVPVPTTPRISQPEPHTEHPEEAIPDGTWLIGRDFPPGKYRTTFATSDCYWAKYQVGKDPLLDNVENNHNGGGNLQVTLLGGQFFETDFCGSWTKVG